MDMSSFLSPIAILVSAAGAWFYAQKAITNSNQIDVKRATFNYVSTVNRDGYFLKKRKEFLKLLASPRSFLSIAESFHQAQNTMDLTPDEVAEIVERHSTIVEMLNEYEAMALAVGSRALDEEMLKANYGHQLIHLNEVCKDFIEFTRATSIFRKPEKIWCELQDLSARWGKDQD